MRVADYIAELLVDSGIKQGFMVTGGGAMHLNDAFGRSRNLQLLFCHHEQACAIAAESYARLTGEPALVSVTTGPGGINALNGVFGAYVDSIPMVIISGQVKKETLTTTYQLPLRQLGDQEVDIISMCRSITKSAIQITETTQVRYVVEKSLWLARNGRPGPVWIDIPIDIQSAQIDPTLMHSFDPLKDGLTSLPETEHNLKFGAELSQELSYTLTRLKMSKRPVVLVGSGLRAAGVRDSALRLFEKLEIPVVTGWNAHDILPNNHPTYCGRPGTVGDRPGNFAVQNADYLLVLGSRLNIRQIGYDFRSFASKAYITMIDIDEAELNKPTLQIDQKIHADLRDVIPMLLDAEIESSESHREYLSWCKSRLYRYPVVLDTFRNPKKPLNPYVFIDELFKALNSNDVIVCGDGTACVVTFQAAVIKEGQRLYTNSGCASMGYDLPAAIGAAIADRSRRVVCLAGDGSIMMNIQELQTIVTNKLDVKIVVLNNNGYSSIRQTQNNYFSDNIVGCGPESGLSFPDFVKVAQSFGIEAKSHEGIEGLSRALSEFLNKDGNQLLEVFLDSEQPFAPKLASRQLPDGSMISGSLDDLAPFLPREELLQNILD